jgi:sec-independent protein translocase protein TatA
MDKMNIIATMFSGPDLLIIFLIVLLLFGANKLPQLAKGMGQAIREFNKAKDEIEKELTKPVNEVTLQPAPGKQEYIPAPPAPVSAAPVPPPPAPVVAETAPKEDPAPQTTTQPLL